MTRTIFLEVQRPIQDITDSADVFDLPMEWYEALSKGLAAEVADKYEVPEDRIRRIKHEAAEAAQHRESKHGHTGLRTAKPVTVNNARQASFGGNNLIAAAVQTPDRKKVFGIALFAWLALGFGGVIGREALDPALHGGRVRQVECPAIEREQVVDFSLINAGVCVNMLFRKKTPFKSYAELAGKRVGVTAGGVEERVQQRDHGVPNQH
mgnify:CR=1 FL=1